MTSKLESDYCRIEMPPGHLLPDCGDRLESDYCRIEIHARRRGVYPAQELESDYCRIEIALCRSFLSVRCTVRIGLL